MTDEIDYIVSSGNVFADLVVAYPDEAEIKADLAVQINSLIERRGLTQMEAASVLGVNQPKVSALRRGKLTGFSIERLLRFLAELGSDVQIVITPTARGSERGHIRMLARWVRRPARSRPSGTTRGRLTRAGAGSGKGAKLDNQERRQPCSTRSE